MRPHPEPTPCSDHSRRPSDQLPPSPQEYGLAEASTAGNGLIGGLFQRVGSPAETVRTELDVSGRHFLQCLPLSVTGKSFPHKVQAFIFTGK